MRLLVSVASASEAEAALAGGADLIDAKDPFSGALGAVPLATLREIHVAVDGHRPVTAALGDAADGDAIARTASDYSAAGCALVKVGFASVTDSAHVEELTRAAVRGASKGERSPCGVVAVAYADGSGVTSPTPDALIDVAARAGATGVLLDTCDKNGPGLRQLMTSDRVASWVRRAHDAGLIVALAGKLKGDDLSWVQDCGADIAGVRGAACERGRTGRVTAERVRLLRVAWELERAVGFGP